MRHRTFHLWMNHLALAAVLALLLVPTTGRMAGMTPMHAEVMQAQPEPGSAPPTPETVAGHPSASTVATPTAAHDVNAAHPHGPQVPGPGPGPHHDMADCGYCLLLQTMTSPSAWIASVAPFAQPQESMALAPPPRRGLRHPTGLGSRGPPHVA